MHHSCESPIYNIRTVSGAIGVQDSHNDSGEKNVLFFGCLFLLPEASANNGIKSGQIYLFTQILQSLMSNDKFVMM